MAIAGILPLLGMGLGMGALGMGARYLQQRQMQKARQERQQQINQMLGPEGAGFSPQQMAMFQMANMPDPMMPQPVEEPTGSALGGELGSLPNTMGGMSTELSITVTDPRLNGGRPTNIPSLVRGQVGVESLLRGEDMTIEQHDIAIQRAMERVAAGQFLPSYNSIEEAVQAARSRSDTKGRSMGRTRN